MFKIVTLIGFSAVLALTPGADLTEQEVTLDSIGRTVRVSDAAKSPEGITAVAIPYFQWDNRDGRAMRIWMPLREPPERP